MGNSLHHREKVQRDVERLRRDPALRRLLRKMPKSVALSFTSDQLHYMRKALTKPSDHKGFEYNILIPLLSKSLFLRIIGGINRRSIERQPSKFANTIGTFVFYLVALVVLLVTVYLVKSFLGIDLFDGISLDVI